MQLRPILHPEHSSSRPPTDELTKGKRLASRVVAAVAATLAASLPAMALDLIWDADGTLPVAGGSGTWNTGTALWTADAGSSFVNWSNSNPDNAIFNGPAGTVSLGESITAGTVTINTAGYTLDLNGSNLTATSIPGTGANNASTIITNTSIAPGTLTVGALTNSGPTLAGNLSVTLNGTSAWTPVTPHSFTGTLWLTGSGTVRADDNRYLGSATGLIRMDGSKVLLFGTPTGQLHTFTRNFDLVTATQGFQVNGAREITLSGTISGAGALRLTSGQGTLILAGNNNYSGATAITGQNGMIILAHDNALGNSTSFTIGSGLLGALGFMGNINVGANAAVTLSGSATASGLGMMHNFTGNNTFAGAISHGSNTVRTYGAEAGTSLTLTGILSGGKGLAKIGQGTVVLTNQNTFPTANATVDNEVSVREGVLRLDFSQATWETSPGVQTNIINNGKTTNSNANEVAQLVLGGGTLEVKGKSGYANSQSFKSGSSTTATNVFTVNPGASAVRAFQNGATSLTIDLGKLLHAQRKVGGTVDFTLPASGAIVLPSVTGSVGSSNAIITANGAAFATVDGTNWASLDAGRNIVSGASVAGFYTANTATTLAGNADMSAGLDTVLAGATTISSLRFHESGTRVLDLNGQVLNTGGVLVTGSGNTASLITGGTLRASSTTANVVNQDLVLVQNNTAGVLTIASKIEDNADGTTPATALTKSGPGTVILTNSANSYTGETHLNGGVLALQGTAVIGAGKLFFHEGVLGLPADTIFTRPAQTAAGNNTLQFIGSGGFAAYGGDITINLGGAAATLTMGGTAGFVPTGSAFILGANDSTGTVIVANPIFLRGANQPQQREIRVHNGTADVDARLTAGFIGANQDGGLTKTGNGTLEVGGAAAAYGGATIIEAGEIRFGITNALPNVPPVTIRSGTLNLNGFNHSPSGGVTMGGGGSGTTSAIATGTGTLNLASNFTYQGNVANDNGATISGNVSLGTLTRTFLVNDSTAAAADVAVLGDISGSGGLRKTGAGTLQLLGNNNYIGATTVAEGVLGVVGTLSGSSAVLVQGGTLSGTGGVGVVTLTSGSIAPGVGIGALHTGDVSLNGGALEIAILDATTADQLDVSGSVNFGGPVNLTLSVASALPATTSLTIINNNLLDPVTFGSASALLVYNGNPLDEGEVFAVAGGFGSQAFQISYAGGTDANDVTLTAVPEPSAALMVLAGVGCLVGYQRRRRPF